MSHETHRSRLGKVADFAGDVFSRVVVPALATIGVVLMFARTSSRTESGPKLDTPVVIAVGTVHTFRLEDGYSAKKYRGIKLTKYAVGEPTVPGTTGRSGRHMYIGGIAVSRDFIEKRMVSFGDVVYIVGLDRSFVIEDTMAERHQMSMDIFVPTIKEAGENPFKDDVIIYRAEKRDAK